jgi:hypothetical protein
MEGRVAETVYGTVVAMAAIVAGAGRPPGQLAVVTAGAVLVIWIAHVHSEVLGEAVHGTKGVDRALVSEVAMHEIAVPLAAVGPIAVLLLGAIGVLDDKRSVWYALFVGLAILLAQGLRYARVTRADARGTLLVVAVNLLLGLAVIGLKVVAAH